MIIELFGLPGAGKSTFARRLSSLRKYKKIKLNSVGEIVLFNLYFLLRHPVKFFGLFFMYLRYAGPRSLWYTKFISVFLDYNAKYMKAKRYRYALLDQGHMQILMSLFEDVLPEKKFRQVVSFLPKSDHYIFFDTSQEIRQKRIQKRGHNSHSRMSEQAHAQWQKTAAVHFENLKKSVKSLSPATIDIVDESADLRTLVNAYQKSQFMRYVVFARMPTEKAHGLQIAKMCDTFRFLGVFTSLVTPQRSNDIHQAVDSFYKMDTRLQHLEAPVVDLTAHVRTMRGIHHYAHELLFAWYVLWMHLPKEVIVYTRTPLVSFVRGLRGNKVIVEQHFWPTKAPRLHRFLLSSAAHIPCNSDGTCTACVEHGLTQAFVSHNGFDSSFLEEEITQREARRGLGLPMSDKIVMYIGSLGDWKGVDTLCEAARGFQDGIKAVVIGGNEDELSPWREEYPHVIFLGPKPYEEIGKHQRAADVLIVPNNPISKESTDYTSPIKLFAYMASGVPILVSDLPALRAIVSEKEVTFFGAGDPLSLTISVKNILSNVESSAIKSAYAKDISTEFTWGNRAHKILEVCNKITT